MSDGFLHAVLISIRTCLYVSVSCVFAESKRGVLSNWTVDGRDPSYQVSSTCILDCYCY